MYEKNIPSNNQMYPFPIQTAFRNTGILHSADVYASPAVSIGSTKADEFDNAKGIFNSDIVLVSDGDLAVPVSSGDLVQAGLVESEIELSADYAQHFQALETKLDIIIFLMLVFWVISKIKNAVRSFTGRNIDN